MRQLDGVRTVRTYVFDLEEFEQAYGICVAQKFYMMHFFEGDTYLGAIKFDGSFTTDYLSLKSSELSSRYWELFE